MTELEMRDMKAPWPKSWDELRDFCESLWTENNDYGKAVYCMSLASVAMFNLAAHKVGATGFQASCADMDILRRTRDMENGFRIVDYSKAMYPQYLESDQVIALLFDELAPLLKDAAAKELATNERAHPNVIAHWKRIVDLGERHERAKPL
jgi:hypothetical protein